MRSMAALFTGSPRCSSARRRSPGVLELQFEHALEHRCPTQPLAPAGSGCRHAEIVELT